MSGWRGFGGAALRVVPPETAHRLALRALAMGLVPDVPVPESERLATRVWGLDFANPLGVAAGFDKDAEVFEPLLGLGFGFVEVGTITPRAQSGNPRPRIFRLIEDEAIINRLGFNNHGVIAAAARLGRRRRAGVVGANIGMNADSADAVADYVACLEALHDRADYLAVNVSSPNTPGLRDLQERAALEGLIAALAAARARVTPAGGRAVPLVLKIAPDLDEAAAAAVAEVALETGLDGLIVGNTTLAREGLASSHRFETGGLSGQPLFARSTALLAAMYRLTQGRVPLVGVGGVSSGADAYAKIRAGASLVALYTAFVFHGPEVVGRILADLDARLAADGFAAVADAVGADAPA